MNDFFSFNKKDQKNFEQEIDAFFENKINPLKLINVGRIPLVMKEVGIKNNLIAMPQVVITKALNPNPLFPYDKQGHELSIADIKKIPNILANPIMIFKSRTRDDSFVFFSNYKDSNNRSIIVPVAENKKYGRLVINQITSIYGRTNEIDYVRTNINQNNLIYIDKKRSLEWERECQVQFLAQVLPKQGVNLNIKTKEQIVKQQLRKNHDDYDMGM